MMKKVIWLMLVLVLSFASVFVFVKTAAAVPATPEYDDWVSKSPMPTARTAAGAAVLSDTIYVIGGFTTGGTEDVVEAYDPSQDQWAPLANMPTPRGNLAAAALDGYLYAIGGWSVVTNTTAVERYDPVSDSWSAMAPLPHGNRGLRAAVWQGKIFVFGGWDGAVVTDTVSMYDPALDAWFSRTPMPTARGALAVAALNGRIYAIGGDNGGGPTDVVEVYDPASDSWSAAARLQSPQSGLNALVAYDRIFAISAGANEMYVPEPDAWIPVTPMPTPREWAVGGNVGEVLYIIGGWVEGSAESAINEAYTPLQSFRLFLPVVRRIEKVGEQLNIYDSGSQTFPENTPFHIAHGWALEPGEPRADLFDFQLEVDGVYRDEDFVERPWFPDLGLQGKTFVFNFYDGMTGTHDFTGHWLGPCSAFYEDCTDPDEIVEAHISDVEVTFIP